MDDSFFETEIHCLCQADPSRLNAAYPPASDAECVARNDGRESRMGAYLYILCCADGSYYVGTTRGELEARIAEHQAGMFDGYTARRRPNNPRLPSAFRAHRRCRGCRAASQRMATSEEGGVDQRRSRSTTRALAPRCIDVGASFETHS